MKRCVRIVAEHAGDPGDPADPTWKLIFDGVLNDTKLVVQPIFGYLIAGARGEEHPFRVLPKGSKKGVILDFGPDDDPPEAINLFEKHITVGELFSWGDSTYKIVKIDDLLQTIGGR